MSREARVVLEVVAAVVVAFVAASIAPYECDDLASDCDTSFLVPLQWGMVALLVGSTWLVALELLLRRRSGGGRKPG